jgi:ComF family protein
MKLTVLWNSFLSLFYPNLCVICREPLMEGEAFFCLHCFLHLPKTRYRSHTSNPAFDRFLGKVPLERAGAYLYYNKGGKGQKIVAAIKYQGNTRLGQWIGESLAKDLSTSGFFDGIDYLVPVPLHPKKLKKRGFNQSEIIARGISSFTHIPLEKQNLYRAKANITQTKKGVYERWKNTADIFQLKDKQLFTKKHILLIDDVLTTGATLEACAIRLLDTPEIQVSILTIAIA